MSLLDKGRETVVIYQEVDEVDRDGNIIKGVNPVGVTTIATIQPMIQSGTSQRRAEQTNEGYETEDMYRMRLPRSFPFILGAQAQVDWLGMRWHVVGKVRRYNGSNRTAHVDYVIRRS
jgi:hypothetical protein